MIYGDEQDVQTLLEKKQFKRAKQEHRAEPEGT